MSAFMSRWLHIVVVAVTAAKAMNGGNFVEEVGERRKRRDGSKDPVVMGKVERHLG